MKRGALKQIAILLSALMIVLTMTPAAAAETSDAQSADYYLENGIAEDTVVNGQLVSEMMQVLHKKGDGEFKNLRGHVTNEKIIAKNASAKTIELELSGKAALAADYSIYQLFSDEVRVISLKDVLLGAENVYTFFNAKGEVQLLVVEGAISITNIRVGITLDANGTVLDHNTASLTSKDGFKLIDKIGDESFDIEPNAVVTITADTVNNTMSAAKNGEIIYSTQNRLYAIPINEDSMLKFTSFKRAYGNPSYRGLFEISLSPVPGKLRLINDVPIEKYLYQVVPSEMPASFGINALKAQAVAARTYAINDCIVNSGLAKEGISVYDNVMSQVYNNSLENSLAAQAVDETNGLILIKDDQYVDCRYYSTSGGYGASIHEVWMDAATKAFPGTPVPYLTARSYTYDPANPDQMYNIDTSDEAAISAFYKDLSFKGYDSESFYFRWKVSLTKQELENTINKNIKLRFAADPTMILTQNSSGEFVSLPIPAEGVGTISNMYVAKRGAGGNIMELVIEGSTGTYKILKEYNIRFTIRPNKTDTQSANTIYAYRAKGGSTAYGSPLANPSILYSAFFTFDIDKAEDGSITSVTFYGGGNGHGVGMSQYGASMLGLSGYTFDQILAEYYSDVEMINMYDIEDNTHIFKGIFKQFDDTKEDAPEIIDDSSL